MIGQVFCDYLSVTMPKDEWFHAKQEIEPILDEILCVKMQDDKAGAYYKGEECGKLQAGFRAGVVWVQASGGLLASLRAAHLLNNYLMVFGVRPHRVTRLDATVDLPHDTPPEIERLYGACVAGQVCLTRKRIDPKQVEKWIGPSLYGGEDTGTIYMGSKAAEVRPLVYDKRQERIKHTGQDIGYSLTRYECRISGKMGPSLRDAVQPASIFFHYMSPSILTRPTEVTEWKPYLGGYEMPKQQILPYESLKRRIETSHDLVRLVQLAQECGPSGIELLISQIRKLAADSQPPRKVS